MIGFYCIILLWCHMIEKALINTCKWLIWLNHLCSRENDQPQVAMSMSPWRCINSEKVSAHSLWQQPYKSPAPPGNNQCWLFGHGPSLIVAWVSPLLLFATGCLVCHHAFSLISIHLLSPQPIAQHCPTLHNQHKVARIISLPAFVWGCPAVTGHCLVPWPARWACPCRSHQTMTTGGGEWTVWTCWCCCSYQLHNTMTYSIRESLVKQLSFVLLPPAGFI